MLDKINIYQIIKDHIGTLKNYESKKYSIEDFIIFFLFPFIISATLIYIQSKLTEGFKNILIVSLSIFAALLFNLLILIYDIIKRGQPNNKEEKHNETQKLKIVFLKQIYTNISFCIFISILTIILLVFSSINITISHIFSLSIIEIGKVLAFFIYAFTLLFILTLFMVLKRVHVLLSKEFQI